MSNKTAGASRHLLSSTAFDALAVAGVLLSPWSCGAALAQTATSATYDDSSEVVVTGSRIQRRDADSVGALLTISAAEIEASGVTSVGDLLQRLPSAGVSLNTNGTQGTSYGASAINLRYLGGAEGSGNRVLVLVDGHRWVDGGGQRGFRDFIDLNTIPLGMIESIEVLKDGASAIYGADAIAGVVNIRTLSDFDGFRLSLRTGITAESDGEQLSGYVNWGGDLAGGHLVMSASYVDDRPVRTDARALTTFSLVPVTSAPVSPNGLYILPGLSNNAFFGTGAGFASSTQPITANGQNIYGVGTLADDSYHVAALPGDYFNTQSQGINSIGASERYGVFARYTADIFENVELSVEGVYNRRTSNQMFSPVLLDIGGASGSIRGFAIPNDHPFNPFGTANGVPIANAIGFTAAQSWRIRRDLVDLGNRNNVQDVETTRIAVGLEGDIEQFGRTWSWDAFVSYAKNQVDTRAENAVNYEHLALGLGSNANCAANPGCVPVNLFGPMTEDQAGYIRYTARESNSTDIFDISLNITGELLQLPAGPLSIAAGYEYREDGAEDHPDPFVNATPTNIPATYTTTTAPTRTPTEGSYNLHEAYVEMQIPLLANAPLADSLDLNLAARYSTYDTVGDATTMKVGVGWRPIADVLVRGTYSQGFRAPSILELFAGARETNFQSIDPCNGGAVANPTLPGCAGVPGAYNQAAYNSGLIAGTISGNPQLEPETADTYSLGLAIQPSAIPGLSITVDWYRVRIQDAIGSLAATQILGLCAQEGGVFCSLVTRDASTGEVLNLLQGSQNLSEIDTSGVDATIRYAFDTQIGAFTAVLDASYLDEFTTTSPNPAGGAPIVDARAGLGDRARSTYPHWKGQASLRWDLDRYGLVWRGRYIGSTTDVANAVKDDHTDAIFYQDLEGSISFNAHSSTLSLGINNSSTNRRPPLTPTPR